jgi:MFS family permease
MIIIGQFCGTSLWFAGNAILPQLQHLYGWQPGALSFLTSSVQLGFILGTLTIAITGVTDRFSPSRIFFISSVTGALCNLLCLADSSSFGLALTSRFLTGVSLAGIYPVGMKIASDWREQGLGHWLGALVGALILGTAFPHALKLFPEFVEPQAVVLTVSALALLGGLLIEYGVHDGPFRKPAARFSFRDIREIVTIPPLRSAALGYFGHMWELYAFWAFVPWVLITYQAQAGTSFSISLWSFLSIAIGFFGCVLGGKLSISMGSKRVAALALASSGLCCIFSPLLFQFQPALFFAFMLFWGFMVAADSPQFSALVAFHAPAHIRGSAITLTTCIGFAITIGSIQLLNALQNLISARYLLLLLSPGPVLGLLWLFQLKPPQWKP